MDLLELSKHPALPEAHAKFLWDLRRQHGFEPKVCYDIGACVMHWTDRAKCVWPNAQFVLFDAFEAARFLYVGHEHHVGVLSDVENRSVTWHENLYFPGGNSYYREIGYKNGALFPPEKAVVRTARTLDGVVAEKGFPMPDLIKIDVQGSEMDVIKGGRKVLDHARVLIVELQHEQYNENAPLVAESRAFIESLGWTCVAEKFSDNGPDADYCFVKNDALSTW